MKIKKFLLLIISLYTILTVFDLDDILYTEVNAYANEFKGSAKSINLDKYQVQIDAKKINGIKKNLSGITYSSTTNLLYAVSNSPRIIYELTKNGKLLREIKLYGFKDTEGISFVRDNLFSVVDERRQTIYVFEINNNTKEIYEKDVVHKFALKIDTFKNFGFEGIAYNSNKDDFFIVNERLPMKIIKISNWLNREGILSISSEDHMNKMNNFMSDFSGLHFNTINNSVLFLSDQSKLLTEVSLDGDKLSFMDLEKGFFGLNADIPQAEGVTLDNEGNLYIVSEPNLFYRYEKKDI